MVRKHLRRTFANFHGSIGWFSAQNRLAYTCKIVKSSSVGKWDNFETCYLWLYFCSYMILNCCYVSVQYAMMFIPKCSFLAPLWRKMNKNDHFWKVVGYDNYRYRMVRKHLRRTFANFHGSIGWFSAQNRLAYTCKIMKSSSVGKWDNFETCYLWLYFCSYMILNGCYVSVGLFCTVRNDVYSITLIFCSIMTKNEQKWTF